jgi:hypothetical protein
MSNHPKIIALVDNQKCFDTFAIALGDPSPPSPAKCWPAEKPILQAAGLRPTG